MTKNSSKKVEEENEDIKLSEISKECSPSLEEELKQKEQEVSHLKEKLSSIQQSLDEKN